jgi:hypothetical protein
MKRFILAVASAVVAIGFFPDSAAAQATTANPRRQAATAELKEAKRELQSSRDDAGGRRREAIKAVDRAIWAIDYVLGSVGEKPGAVVLDPARYPEFKDHVHVRRALTDLNSARDEVTAAQGDRWGLRKAALQDIQQAIDLLKDLLPEGK